MVTTAVILVTSRFPLTYAISLLFANELRQYLVWFSGYKKKTVFTSKPMRLSTGEISNTEIWTQQNCIAHQTSFSYQDDTIWFSRTGKVFILPSQWGLLYWILLLTCQHVQLVNYLFYCQSQAIFVEIFYNFLIKLSNLIWFPEQIVKYKYIRNHKSFFKKINADSMAILSYITSNLPLSSK